MSSSASNSSCITTFTAEVSAHQTLAHVSLGLTLACIILRRCMAAKFDENPKLGSKVFFSLAFVKFILGVALIVKFPSCPDGCICQIDPVTYVYPVLVIFLSIVWASLGNKYLKQANLQANSVQVVEENMETMETMEVT